MDDFRKQKQTENNLEHWQPVNKSQPKRGNATITVTITSQNGPGGRVSKSPDFEGTSFMDAPYGILYPEGGGDSKVGNLRFLEIRER